MVLDKDELWFAELEKQNNEHMVLLEKAMLEDAKQDEINAERLTIKALSAAKFKAKHPILSFVKYYSVIIIIALVFLITLVSNIIMLTK